MAKHENKNNNKFNKKFDFEKALRAALQDGNEKQKKISDKTRSK